MVPRFICNGSRSTNQDLSGHVKHLHEQSRRHDAFHHGGFAGFGHRAVGQVVAAADDAIAGDVDEANRLGIARLKADGGASGDIQTLAVGFGAVELQGAHWFRQSGNGCRPGSAGRPGWSPPVRSRAGLRSEPVRRPESQRRRGAVEGSAAATEDRRNPAPAESCRKAPCQDRRLRLRSG